MATTFFTKASASAQELTAQLLDEAGRKNADLRKMKSLIDAGADINGRDDKTRTVLMVAASKRNKDAAELLIDNGADMYARDGNTPDANAMFYALAHYDVDMVRMFLDKKFDPNRGACRGKMTALMWAANFHKLDLCEELARRGADINAKNPDNGWTAMSYAEDNLKPHIADRLRAIDADNKALAVRREAEERLRAQEAKVAAAKAELDAVCDAGLPVRSTVVIMHPLTFKPPVKV